MSMIPFTLSPRAVGVERGEVLKGVDSLSAVNVTVVHAIEVNRSAKMLVITRTSKSIKTVRPLRILPHAGRREFLFTSGENSPPTILKKGQSTAYNRS